MIASLEQLLEAQRIKVKESPKYEIQLGVDESGFETLLRNKIGYRNDEALLHDLRVLTAIHRLRGGQRMFDLERCRSVFVTTNVSLAQASTDFFVSELRGGSFVPHCLLSDTFVTLLWLKDRSHAPELPARRLIADAYAALNPDDSMWRRYLAEVERLSTAGTISGEEYAILRYSLEARRILMDQTLGGSRAFTEGSVSEVLERARLVFAQEQEKRVIVEREHSAREHMARQDAESRAGEAIASMTAHSQLVEANTRRLADRLGAYVATALLVPIVPAVVTGIVLSVVQIMGPLPSDWPRIPTVFAAIIVVSMILLYIANALWGSTLTQLHRWLRIRATNLVFSSLRARLLANASATKEGDDHS